MNRSIFHGTGLLGLATIAVGTAFFGNTPARAQVVDVTNPDWEIYITEFGYSDLLFDLRPMFNGREYLSGEWGAAVSYTIDATDVTPTWLQPYFIFPDWTTNSDFVADGNFFSVTPDPSGFDIYSSTIANSDLQITQTYQMLDTATGIEQGWVPASLGGSGGSVTSNQYILQQTYQVTNISGQTISNLDLFQFLHGFHSQEAVYDDRFYGGPYGEYQYDITERGVSLTLIDVDVGGGVIVATQDPGTLPILSEDLFGLPLNMLEFTMANINNDYTTVADNLANEPTGSGALVLSQDPDLFDLIVQTIVDGDVFYEHEDIIAFHSAQMPTAYEVGAYGLEGIDDHITGKPGEGVHISVEADALSNTDGFFPEQLWVSGAQQFALGNLSPDQTVTFDVLLSISTATTVVPLPPALWLLASALGGLGWFGGRRRQRMSVAAVA